MFKYFLLSIQRDFGLHFRENGKICSRNFFLSDLALYHCVCYNAESLKENWVYEGVNVILFIYIRRPSFFM